MADKFLSIEIGYSLTKVCEIEKGPKHPKVLNSFVIATPEGTVNDGIIEVNDEFVSNFRIAMSEKKIRTKKAIFTIVSNRIVAKDVTIPFVKENRIQDVVRANITDYFPVDPSQYMFAHNVTGVVRDEVKVLTDSSANKPEKVEKRDGVAENNADNVPDSKKNKKANKKSTQGKATGYKLQVLAAPKPLYDSYVKLAKALGLDIQNIDYNGNSIYQAAKEECKEGVQLIVKIDEKNSLLMVFDNGVIALNRTIPYGIDDAVDTIMQTKAFGEINSYEEAMNLARRKTVILSNFKGELMATDETEDDNEQFLADKKLVTDSLRMLAGGMLRVIDYYNSNHSDNPIKKAYLTGIGADFSGIGTLLSDELEMKVKNLTHLAGLDGEKIFADATFGEFVTVIGASMNPLKFYRDHDDSTKAKGKGGKKDAGYKGSSLLIALGVLLLGLLASGGMILYTMLPYNEEKELNAKYNQTISELQPSYDVYLQFLQSEQNLRYMRAILKSSDNRNNQLVEFIEYLEDNMPFSFCLNSLNTTTDTVTLEATVSTKEESAFALEKLKECDIFTSADLSAVSYIENDLGEVLYGFTVELNYAPMDVAEDEDAENGEDNQAVGE